jgi:hypothetical protein
MTTQCLFLAGPDANSDFASGGFRLDLKTLSKCILQYSDVFIAGTSARRMYATCTISFTIYLRYV